MFMLLRCQISLADDDDDGLESARYALKGLMQSVLEMVASLQLASCTVFDIPFLKPAIVTLLNRHVPAL
jgi:hypothetical protein